MNFLKTIFWVILIIALVIFAVNNWVPISVKLWGGMLLDTKLPMLVIISFIVGFLPLWLWHRTVHWRMKRKIMSLESSNYRQPINMADERISSPITSSPTPTAPITGVETEKTA